jgi:hypothetical protein
MPERLRNDLDQHLPRAVDPRLERAEHAVKVQGAPRPQVSAKEGALYPELNTEQEDTND